MRNVFDKVVEKMKTHILYSIIFFENRTVYEIMSKNIVEIEGLLMTSQHGAYALHVGLARLYTRTRMHTDQYAVLIAFHSNNGFVNAFQSYVDVL